MDKNAEQVLLGSMMGDGCLTKSKGIKTNPRYSEVHCIKQKEYLLWKSIYFKKLFNIKFLIKIPKQNRIIKSTKQIYLYSNTCPFLLYYYNLFYVKTRKKRNGKIITIESLNKLKLLGLAIWYMDDGNFCRGRASLTINDKYIRLVKKWFKEKFGIEGKINNLCFYLNVKNSKKFINLIKVYIPKCMEYKIIQTEADKEKFKKYIKKYREENKYEIKENRKEYYLKNKKEFLLKTKSNYRKNREKILKRQKRYYQKNKKRIKEYSKNYYRGIRQIRKGKGLCSSCGEFRKDKKWKMCFKCRKNKREYYRNSK